MTCAASARLDGSLVGVCDPLAQVINCGGLSQRVADLSLHFEKAIADHGQIVAVPAIERFDALFHLGEPGFELALPADVGFGQTGDVGDRPRER